MSAVLSTTNTPPLTNPISVSSDPINIKRHARKASPSLLEEDDHHNHGHHSTSPYTRRVSFNNLHPDEDSHMPPNQAIYNLATPHNYTPSYTTYSAPQSLSSATHSSHVPSIESTFNSLMAKPPSGSYVPRKRLKLPDPPSKSILKNRVSEQQLEYNEKNDLYEESGDIDKATIRYHSDDEIMADPQSPPPPPTGIASPETPRRKSYAGMTDEELLALDPQFQTKSVHDLDKFKFDNQKTYYLSPSTRRSSSTPSMLSQPTTTKKITYPTSNENNYRSISLTVKHEEFDTIQYNRTLLTVLNGRKHTWNSIDWLLLIDQHKSEESSFLIDGDYLIIAALIPNSFIKDYSSKRKKTSMYDFLHNKCSNLLDYVVEYSSKLNLKLKITVEYVLDNPEDSSLSTVKVPYGEKYMLQKLFKQYEPNIIITGNKSSNLNFKYPIKMSSTHQQFLIKLSSYILKYSTIPVIFVGNNILTHEVDDKPSISTLKFNQADHSSGPKIVFSVPTPASLSIKDESSPTTQQTPTSDAVSTHSSSSSLISSIESFQEASLTKQATNSAEELRRDKYSKTIQSVNERDFNDPSKYLDLITAISDNSFVESTNFLAALNSKNSTTKIDEKIYAIYKSQSSPGGSTINAANMDEDAPSPIYKVKSMINYDDYDESKNDKLRAELKKKRAKSMERNAVKSTKSNESSIGLSLNSSGSGGEKKTSIWKKLMFRKK